MPSARAATVRIEPEVLEERADAKALLGDIGFRKARYVLNQEKWVEPFHYRLYYKVNGKVFVASPNPVRAPTSGCQTAGYGLTGGT